MARLRARTPALALLGAAALSGCFLDHQSVEEVPPPPPEMPPPGPTCGLTDGSVRVVYEERRIGSVACDRGGGWIDAQLDRVEPLADGVRLHLDACPLDARHDCTCELSVYGIGEEVAPQMGAGILPVQVQGTFSEQHVDLSIPTACDLCEGCYCPPSWLVLFAADAEPGFAADSLSGLSFFKGAPTCAIPTSEDCRSVRQPIVATHSGPSSEPLLIVDEGVTAQTTRDAEATRLLTLKVIRSHQIDCITPEDYVPYQPSAWVAWDALLAHAGEDTADDVSR